MTPRVTDSAQTGLSLTVTAARGCFSEPSTNIVYNVYGASPRPRPPPLMTSGARGCSCAASRRCFHSDGVARSPGCCVCAVKTLRSAPRRPCSSRTSVKRMGGNLGCHRRVPADLSAACSFGPVAVRQRRVNINAAAEEELMTLPGVSRTVARDIVWHRERIGGFRKAEDLALVSGVGAAKLALVRAEICVGRAPVPGRSRRRPRDGVNVNTATAAQLLSIGGVSEQTAGSIVRYRREHGPFRCVGDLVRVPRVSASLLEKIRPYVFVEGPPSPSSASSSSSSSFSSTSEEGGGGHALLCASPPGLPAGGPAHLQWTRPPVELFAGLREGRPVLRVATWSLQRCSRDKARNPGVAEVLCMSVLENGIKLLAVQDLVDREALEKFCTELNQGTLPSVRGWKAPRGVWKCAVSEKPARRPCHETPEFCGFLWDSSAGIELNDATLVESAVVNGNGAHAYPRPYLARFRVGSSQLTVVNVHWKGLVPDGETNGKKHSALRFTDGMQEILRGEKELLLLGDFGLPPDSRELELLKKEKLSPLIPPTIFTNISTKAPQGSRCLDNIWVSRSLKKVYTGHYRVVREGLTNPWIPDNWSWGGVASDHCPLLAEFYADAGVRKGGLQNGCWVPAVEHVSSLAKRER
ncbi:endonuclease/exonuclease/phosphatase family domain-containing protein 1-like [Arapaima gigas]